MSNERTDRQPRTNPAEVTEIDLAELFKHVFKFWPLIILAALVGAALMGGTKYIKKYTYTSSAMIYVLSSTTSISSLAADLQLGTQLSDDFVVMLQSKPVIDSAIKDVEDELGVTLTRGAVLSGLSIEHEDSTRILTINCTTEDAELSKVLCDAITTRGAQRMSEITQSDPPTLIESAEVAETPNGRGVVSQAEKGALLGAVLMIIVLCIPYLIYDKIRKSDDIEKYLGEVVIGVVPYEKSLGFRRRRHRR